MLTTELPLTRIDTDSNSISEFFNDYLPAAQKILMPVAQKCGFEESSEGCAYFVEHIKQYSAKPEGMYFVAASAHPFFPCDVNEKLQAQSGKILWCDSLADTVHLPCSEP